jgi:hypothetical protein
MLGCWESNLDGWYGWTIPWNKGCFMTYLLLKLAIVHCHMLSCLNARWYPTRGKWFSSRFCCWTCPPLKHDLVASWWMSRPECASWAQSSRGERYRNPQKPPTCSFPFLARRAIYQFLLRANDRVTICAFPKLEVPPVIIHVHRIFNYKPSSYWAIPVSPFMETSICSHVVGEWNLLETLCWFKSPFLMCSSPQLAVNHV